jgi:hypothetical protein
MLRQGGERSEQLREAIEGPVQGCTGPMSQIQYDLFFSALRWLVGTALRWDRSAEPTRMNRGP